MSSTIETRTAISPPEVPTTSIDATPRPATGPRTEADIVRPEASPPAAPAIVRLDGALDIATAPALRERLAGLLHPGVRLLVLDLSGVSSCDSAGLAVLVGAERRARVLGIVMRLAAPSPPVARLLHLTGLDRNLTIDPDLATALSAQQHEPAPALRKE